MHKGKQAIIEKLNAPICSTCAEKKGWKLKGICGWWVEECAHCGVKTSLCAERDYKKPGQRPLTIDDLYLHGIQKTSGTA